MKKYIYAGILLGAMVLTGCSENKESEEKAQINEKAANEHAIEAELVLEDKVVSVTPLELTHGQKVDYHKKYTEIVDAINAREDTIYTLEIAPINEFNSEDWIEIEDFKKLAEDRANAKMSVLENNDRYNPNTVPKTVKLYMGSHVATIILNGSFETQLNSNTPDGRQLFSKFNSISSELEKNDGSWTQTGYDVTRMDGGVSYNIIVGGKYSKSGIISSHNIEVEFNCDIYGGIS